MDIDNGLDLYTKKQIKRMDTALKLMERAQNIVMDLQGELDDRYKNNEASEETDMLFGEVVGRLEDATNILFCKLERIALEETGNCFINKVYMDEKTRRDIENNRIIRHNLWFEEVSKKEFLKERI